LRIIDKNTDFYDYLQSPTDTIVFDRRNSFLLTKKVICDRIIFLRGEDTTKFLLLQCGSTFWLFLLTATKLNTYGGPEDYDIELLTSWKNYDKPRKCISFEIIKFNFTYRTLFSKHSEKDQVHDRIMKSVDKLQYAIDHNEYEVSSRLDTMKVYKDHKGGFVTSTSNIPLLKGCGIANLVDPFTIFYAIEEYFSMEKTASETTEPKGATNDDKIIMHGFDTKTSFRGKR